MKTQGEIEAAICEGIGRFEQEYRGRGPKDIHAYLLGDFVVVRLQGLLTPAEQQLARSPSDKGRDLLKQVRTHLIETSKPLIQAMVQEITGVAVVSLHHDISTVTGEAFVVLTLAGPPSFRQSEKWIAHYLNHGNSLPAIPVGHARLCFQGGKLDAVSEPKGRQDADAHVGHIHFPPPQTVAGGGLEGVMVVVPAFAIGQRATHQRFVEESRVSWVR